MTAPQEQADKVTASITSIANDLRELVVKIEASIATTRNHYGDYMNLIMAIAGDNDHSRNIVTLALIEAGANRQGVADALKAVT